MAFMSDLRAKLEYKKWKTSHRELPVRGVFPRNPINIIALKCERCQTETKECFKYILNSKKVLLAA
jgi:hypothetical protein